MATMSTCSICCYLCTAVGCCALSIVYLVYLGIFAFNNPDNQVFYTSQGSEEKLTATLSNKHSVDVHAQFVGWFTVGFSLAILPCATGLVSGLIFLINETCAGYFSKLITCLSGCVGIAWFITGIVWRFRESGSIASGDQLSVAEYEQEIAKEDTLYQFKSGKFMLVYYIIVWTLIGISCAMGCLACILSCFCKSD